MSCNTPCAKLLSASQSVTECICLGSGPVDCRLHRCAKTAHFHQLCQRDPRYFRLWQEGKGPGQTGVPPAGQNWLPLGSWAAAAIRCVTFGYIKPCTECKSRAAALDRCGMRISNGLRWLVGSK